MMAVVRNPDHVTVAVADGAAAIRFFGLLGFREQHVASIGPALIIAIASALTQ